MSNNKPLKVPFDLVGEKLDRLMVLEPFKKNGLWYYNVTCDCGVSKQRARRSLLIKGLKSCGCYAVERAASLIKRQELSTDTMINGVLFKAHPNRLFAVSCSGEVLGRSGKILSLRNNGRGYKSVNALTEEGSKKYRNYYVHRLVAETWISNPDPDNLKEVNHIDGNKSNNHMSNLEWVNRKNNVAHAIEIGLIWNHPKPGQKGFQRKTE